MKKMFLIPMLVIPFFTLSSCAQLSDYELSDAARENAIAMVGVNYLQTNIDITIGGQHQSESYVEYSPTVYYRKFKNESGESFYQETYVIRHAPAVYTKFYRFNEQLEFIGPESAILSDWDDAPTFGGHMLQFYREIKSHTSFTYNKDEKCYVASFTQDTRHSEFKYYFYKKKLIKISMSFNPDEQLQTISCGYDNITPTPPTPPEN